MTTKNMARELLTAIGATINNLSAVEAQHGALSEGECWNVLESISYSMTQFAISNIIDKEISGYATCTVNPTLTATPIPLPCPGVYNGWARLYKLSRPYQGFDYAVVSDSSRIPETLLFGCGADGRADLAGYVELAGEHFTRSTAEALLSDIGYYLEEEVAA